MTELEQKAIDALKTFLSAKTEAGFDAARKEARAVIEEAEYALAEPVNARLVERIKEAIDAYERFGAICTFEGEPMIHASTLLEIAEIAAEAMQAGPVRLTDERIFDICKSMLVEGYHGDYLENDGFELAKEIEAETLRANGFKVED